MTRLVLVLVSIMVLSSCASAPRTPAVVEARVQVNVPCDPGSVPAPAFPIDGLTGDEDWFNKAQTMAADIEVREGYESRLRSAVDSCRP